MATKDTSLSTIAARSAAYRNNPFRFGQPFMYFAKLVKEYVDGGTAGAGTSSTQSRLRSAGAALTTATTANVTATALTLTAGTYLVSASVGLQLTGATLTTVHVGVSATSATLPATDAIAVGGAATGEVRVARLEATTTASADLTYSVASYKVTLAATTTLYLVAQATFSAGTVATYGSVTAQKVAAN